MARLDDNFKVSRNIDLAQFLQGWRERNMKLVAFGLGVECDYCGEIGLCGELCDRCGRRVDGEPNGE